MLLSNRVSGNSPKKLTPHLTLPNPLVRLCLCLNMRLQCACPRVPTPPPSSTLSPRASAADKRHGHRNAHTHTHTHTHTGFLYVAAPDHHMRDKMRSQLVIFKSPHTYVMSWLYVVCFGTFIGFSSSFPKLIQVQFFFFGHHVL